MRPLVLGLFMLVACSSSSSSTGAAGGGAPQFKITLPSSEVIDFPCDADTSGASVVSGSLQFTCDVGASAPTAPGIFVPGFHGNDTYALQQTAGADQTPIVDFTADNYAYAGLGAAPGFAATTCSTSVTASATPKKGDAVSGKFHCDNVEGNIVVGDGGHNPSQLTSVDGTFSGSFTQ